MSSERNGTRFTSCSLLKWLWHKRRLTRAHDYELPAPERRGTSMAGVLAALDLKTRQLCLLYRQCGSLSPKQKISSIQRGSGWSSSISFPLDVVLSSSLTPNGFVQINRLDKLLQIISKFSSRPIHDEALEEPGDMGTGP